MPLVGVDVMQAVVRGEDGYGGEGRTVLEDKDKGLWLGVEVAENAAVEEAESAAGQLYSVITACPGGLTTGGAGG